jgi:hypothetical protein
MSKAIERCEPRSRALEGLFDEKRLSRRGAIDASIEQARLEKWRRQPSVARSHCGGDRPFPPRRQREPWLDRCDHGRQRGAVISNSAIGDATRASDAAICIVHADDRVEYRLPVIIGAAEA